jgi:hypothetical protein
MEPEKRFDHLTPIGPQPTVSGGEVIGRLERLEQIFDRWKRKGPVSGAFE